jgi:hypothetical protein
MKHIRRHLIFCLFSINAIALLSIFCATYPFWRGVFFQVNAVLICLHVVSFITSIIFCFLLIRKDRVLLSTFLSPVSLMWLFFVLWGIIVSFVSKKTSLSFLGHPAIGEGLVTFINFYSSFISFLYLSRFPIYKKLILLIVIGICFVLILISLTTNPYSPFRPYWYNEYLGFYVLFLIFIPLIYSNIKSTLYAISWVLFIIVLLILTHNKASFLAIGVAIFYYGLYQFKIIQRIKFSYAFLFILLIPFLMPFLTKIFISIAYFQEHYASIVSSLFWRDQSNQVIVKDLISHPVGLFIGNGWGHFEDLVKTYFEEGIFQGWKKTLLDEINRTSFHSHNLILELLHATGFVGLVLFMNFLLILIVKVKKNIFLPFTCFVVSFLTLSSFWFMVPSIYPLLAALCAGSVQLNYKKWRYERMLSLLIVLFFGCISIWAAMIRFNVA